MKRYRDPNYKKHWRERNREKVREYDKKFNRTPRRKAYLRKYAEEHREQRREAGRRFYWKHRERINRERNNELRHTRLCLKDGTVLNNLNKYPYTGYCEVCLKAVRLGYHHWEEDPNVGMWLCPQCHDMAEGIDRELDVMYRALKEARFKK